jgi:hypothetical protein
MTIPERIWFNDLNERFDNKYGIDDHFQRRPTQPSLLSILLRHPSNNGSSHGLQMTTYPELPRAARDSIGLQVDLT